MLTEERIEGISIIFLLSNSDISMHQYIHAPCPTVNLYITIKIIKLPNAYHYFSIAFVLQKVCQMHVSA